MANAEDINAKIARRIELACKRRGLATEDLAIRSGVRLRNLLRAEYGAYRLSVEELERIAAALALPFGHFLEECVLCGRA